MFLIQWNTKKQKQNIVPLSQSHSLGNIWDTPSSWAGPYWSSPHQVPEMEGIHLRVNLTPVTNTVMHIVTTSRRLISESLTKTMTFMNEELRCTCPSAERHVATDLMFNLFLTISVSLYLLLHLHKRLTFTHWRCTICEQAVHSIKE